MIGAMPLAFDSKQQGSIGYTRKNISLHFRPPVLTNTSHSSTNEHSQDGLARHCANKRLMFQLSVLAPLCGALLLFIGLVQLLPGADGESFSLPLILIGSLILFLGLFIVLFRFFFKYEIEGTGQQQSQQTHQQQEPLQQQQQQQPQQQPLHPDTEIKIDEDV